MWSHICFLFLFSPHFLPFLLTNCRRALKLDESFDRARLVSPGCISSFRWDVTQRRQLSRQETLRENVGQLYSRTQRTEIWSIASFKRWLLKLLGSMVVTVSLLCRRGKYIFFSEILSVTFLTDTSVM